MKEEIERGVSAPPKISVIVPVYNAEKYLHRCIDSILSQTFTDFELLLIDDGSKDRSSIICDEYAIRDSRVRVFHKLNGGVASARNIGIKMAKGKFSIHVDSDDFVDKDMLSDMVSEIEQKGGDILIANYYEYNFSGDRLVKQYYKNTNSLEIIRMFFRYQLLGSLWNKLIRHELYRKYKIEMLEKIDYCEDLVAVIRLLLKTDNVIFIDKAYYHYDVTNNNSITRNFNRDSFRCVKQMLLYLETVLPDSLKSDFCSVALAYKGLALKNDVMTRDEIKGFLGVSNIVILKSVMRHKMYRRVKLNVLLANILGLRFSKPFIKFINR